MAAETQLDLTAITTGTLIGAVQPLEIEEKDAAGAWIPTNSIMRTDRDWRVTVKWYLEGSMLGSMFFTIPGTWEVTGYLEAWGQLNVDQDLPGDSGAISVVPPPAISGSGASTRWEYTETITITAANNPPPGPYYLAVAVTYRDAAGNPGPMAGFQDGNMLQIYQPV